MLRIDPPSEQAQRGLVLISKLLQNIANGIFDTSKEEHVVVLNQFISDNSKAIQEFFEELAVL